MIISPKQGLLSVSKKRKKLPVFLGVMLLRKKCLRISGPSKLRYISPKYTLWHCFTELSSQAIQYLTADYQPTSRQSDASITQLTRNLAHYDLAKAEKLQIVNLAPTEAVELYVVSVWYFVE